MQEKTLTRADIIDTLVKRVGLSKQDSGAFLERVLELVSAELEADNDVKFARFGNFVVRKKNARVGRNPRTGEEAPISARRVVSFKPSPLLRQRVEAAHSDDKGAGA
ncbi:MAG: integration host factor subunit alpha [Hyphomonadaceae bacterium]